jgi:hypothetical protein
VDSLYQSLLVNSSRRLARCCWSTAVQEAEVCVNTGGTAFWCWCVHTRARVPVAVAGVRRPCDGGFTWWCGTHVMEGGVGREASEGWCPEGLRQGRASGRRGVPGTRANPEVTGVSYGHMRPVWTGGRQGVGPWSEGCAGGEGVCERGTPGCGVLWKEGCDPPFCGGCWESSHIVLDGTRTAATAGNRTATRLAGQQRRHHRCHVPYAAMQGWRRPGEGGTRQCLLHSNRRRGPICNPLVRGTGHGGCTVCRPHPCCCGTQVVSPASPAT